MSSLKIDIRNGLLEIEGEDVLVKLVYEDYKAGLFNLKFENLQTSSGNDSEQVINLAPKSTSKIQPAAKRPQKIKTQSKNKESFSIVKDLDLSSRNGTEGLQTFYTSKSPSSLMEKNAVFVYYLKKILNLEKIGVDHIYTCYKEVKEPVPAALRQSLWDAASKKGWLDTNSLDDIKVVVRGENLIEQELGVKSQNANKSK